MSSAYSIAMTFAGSSASAKPLISAAEVELYYEGFSNDGLWPLYHDALRESTYDADQWDAYGAVNQRFADVLAVQDEVADADLQRLEHHVRASSLES